MKSFEVGDKVRIKRDGKAAEVVGVQEWPESGPYVKAVRYEVHVRDGARLDGNLFLREYELEHAGRVRS